MLADRPVMAQHVEPGDTLWIWAVRKFAGEDLGSLVEWNAEETEHFPGRSGRPWNGRNAGIQVSTTRVDLPDNRPSTFDELWLTAVFELHNVTSSPDWDRIDGAIQGELMRDEYIVAMLESEELAAPMSPRAFYLKVFLPWLRSKNLTPPDPREWCCRDFSPEPILGLQARDWRQDRRWPEYEAAYDTLRGVDKIKNETTNKQRHIFTRR